MSSLSYFRLTQEEEPSSFEKAKPGFKGFETSILTKILRKLLKVPSTPLFSSTLIGEPKALPIAMAFFMVKFCRGSP
jgi:hypothetical protein